MIAVDLFAGMGGFTAGVEAAGCSVVWAANHWPEAVAVHAANHPRTAHACQDLHQMDWSQVPSHDLLTASPACQGFSRARGAHQPRHDVARSTAWAVVAAAECRRPAVVLVENVPEFAQWTLFPAWSTAMQALGYMAATHILNAADFGVPQSRERLFIVLTRSKAPITLNLQHRPMVPARSIIDFTAGRWAPIRRPGRAAKTLVRALSGREVHGERFLVSYYGSTQGGRSLDKPLGTLTTRDRHAVIDGDRMRMLTVDEVRAGMGFPASYHLPKSHKLAVHMLGNAVCPPVATALINAVREAA